MLSTASSARTHSLCLPATYPSALKSSADLMIGWFSLALLSRRAESTHESRRLNWFSIEQARAVLCRAVDKRFINRSNHCILII